MSVLDGSEWNPSIGKSWCHVDVDWFLVGHVADGSTRHEMLLMSVH